MKPWKPLPPMPFTSTIPEILAAIENRWPEERLVNSDARDDVMTLIARVRELEAESAKWKAGFEEFRSRNTDLMMQLFEAQEKARAINIGPVLHENAQLRSHARAVSNLLAIIHGDGGHYEGKHGTVKACKDAEGVVSDLRLKLDAATYALGEKP
jgi:hypothetical protein